MTDTVSQIWHEPDGSRVEARWAGDWRSAQVLVDDVPRGIVYSGRRGTSEVWWVSGDDARAKKNREEAIRCLVGPSAAAAGRE